MSANQINVGRQTVLTGKNEQAALAMKKRHGYKSDRWISYADAKSLDILHDKMRGHGVSCVAFPKEGGETKRVPYTLFNLDIFENVPQELLTVKGRKVSSKATKKAAPKATKRTAKKAAKAANNANKKAPVIKESPDYAIPVKDEPNTYLIKDEHGVYQKVTIK